MTIQNLRISIKTETTERHNKEIISSYLQTTKKYKFAAKYIVELTSTNIEFGTKINGIIILRYV